MCVIVDTCCIPLVFDVKALDHARFAPLFAWIKSPHGRLIFGGTKYNRELRGMTKFLKLFLEYSKQGKLVRLEDSEVDDFASKAKSLVTSKAFNDEHLVGMVAVSRCRVVCTDDKEAIPFITRQDLYEAVPMRPPKIYNRRSHRHLCNPKNVVSLCR